MIRDQVSMTQVYDGRQECVVVFTITYLLSKQKKFSSHSKHSRWCITHFWQEILTEHNNYHSIKKRFTITSILVASFTRNLYYSTMFIIVHQTN